MKMIVMENVVKHVVEIFYLLENYCIQEIIKKKMLIATFEISAKL